MLPEERAVANALLPEFKAFVSMAMDKAHHIFAGRETERDLEAPVWMKMPFGELSFATLSHTKTARICASLRTLAEAGYLNDHGALATLAAGRAPTNDEGVLKHTDEKIDDELLDTINYCAFHWAYRRLMERQTNIEQAPVEPKGRSQ